MESLLAQDRFLSSFAQKYTVQPPRATKRPNWNGRLTFTGGSSLPIKGAKHLSVMVNSNERDKPTKHVKKQKGKQSQVKEKPNKEMTKEKSVNQSDSADTRKPGTSCLAVELLRSSLRAKMAEGKPIYLTKEQEEKRERRRMERERRKKRKHDIQKVKDEQQEIKSEPDSEQLEIKKELGSDTVNHVDSLVSKPNIEQEPIDLSFNLLNVEEERIWHKSKEDKKKEKKMMKGGIKPLTGKNYKQLLSRLEMHKQKIEGIRAQNEEKAHRMEKRMQWTAALYRAEGIHIKDDEGKLRAALHRKEGRKIQRRNQWELRSTSLTEYLERKQGRRQKNVQSRVQAKSDRRKERAHKRGRVLPEDLARLGL
uniref:surfeit locus protein 6 homolog n=1 Tax=Myxine glutinosa TaxID=7769 RepID=UPI00358ECBB7